jgi:hypothetical protein
MKDQLDLNRSLIEILKKSEGLMAKIKQSEVAISQRIGTEESKQADGELPSK